MDTPATTTRPTSSTTTPLPLKIDGAWYDVGGWADEHPGGRWLLEYARGRDVTALFHAVHMKSQQKSELALRKLPRLEASSLPQPGRPCPFPGEQEREQTLQGEYVLAGLYGSAPPACLKGVVAIAPYGMACDTWSEEAAAGLGCPLLLLAGDQDRTSGYLRGVRRLFSCGAAPCDRPLVSRVAAAPQPRPAPRAAPRRQGR